jgi:hypothetical protein
MMNLYNDPEFYMSYICSQGQVYKQLIELVVLFLHKGNDYACLNYNKSNENRQTNKIKLMKCIVPLDLRCVPWKLSFTLLSYMTCKKNLTISQNKSRISISFSI